MREIKFRGKRVDNGEWIYGFYFESFTGISYILKLHDHILGITDYCEVIPGSVGQFTGLHDKNGKEIYEGDVVRCRAGVEYQGISEYDKQFVIEFGWSQSMWEMAMCDSIEVIGNIYDNPELLGESNG